MEAYINNAQVLYSKVRGAIDEVAEEKPFGNLTYGDIQDVFNAILNQLT